MRVEFHRANGEVRVFELTRTLWRDRTTGDVVPEHDLAAVVAEGREVDWELIRFDVMREVA